MALIDESREAWLELYDVMPSEGEFNGLKAPCVAETLSIKRAQQLHSYLVDGSTMISMLAEDYDDPILGKLTGFSTWEANGFKDLKSTVQINGQEPLTYMKKDTHPQSAVVHLFLSPPT